MDDPVLIGIRFLLFTNLMLLAGIAAFPLCALTRQQRQMPALAALITRPLFWLCLGGLLTSLLGMFVLAASMQGVGLLALEARIFLELIEQSDAGSGWIIRNVALVGALTASFGLRRFPTAAPGLVAAFASVAVATLAWSGHAGAAEGGLGMLHRASDILHMLAAAAWIGALLAFLLLLWPTRIDRVPGGLSIAAQSLERFSFLGSIYVATIIVTGLVNAQLIVGTENLGRSLSSPYGQLLAAKLLFFGLMLALAASNRWRLAPRLGAADLVGSRGPVAPGSAATLEALRKSLLIEAGAGLTILALVAWLGTAEPFVAG